MPPGSARRETGLLGPVSLSAGALLLLLSPLIRGGNRYMALIPLEFLGLLILFALWSHWATQRQPEGTGAALSAPLLVLLAGPAILAVVYLVPVPAAIWTSLPGRGIYEQPLAMAGASLGAWRPLSVHPDATSASLLAGIPLVAAFLLGYLATLRQLGLLFRLVVGIAFLEVLLGIFQVAGGQFSPLFFGILTYGPPIGTFANRNHFANYLGMALAAYIWLGYEVARQPRASRTSSGRNTLAIRGAGGLLLVLGILLSQSRGGALFGLTLAALAFGLASLRLHGWVIGWRIAVPMLVVILAGAAALMGFDAATSRLSLDQLASSAGFRTSLARTSLDGALAFWPWGAGWGTYELAYPRFQPASLPGNANHAHEDYVEMLFEGGMFFVILAAAFFWTAAARATKLVKSVMRHRALGRESMASALCGLGLLGLLLHSLVEFNMRIPANAMLGALLAGVYLRPLGDETASQ
jgi:hypothetical protein